MLERDDLLRQTQRDIRDILIDDSLFIDEKVEALLSIVVRERADILRECYFKPLNRDEFLDDTPDDAA